jgi:transcriptional regulator ATRX
VLSIKLTPMQASLYKFYMESKARQGDDGGRKGSILFQDFQNLQRIWSAPKALRYNSDRYELEMQRRRDLESEEEESVGSIKDFLDDSESAASTGSESSEDEEESDAQSINSDEVKKKKKKKKKDKGAALPRRTRAMMAARK